MSNTKERRWRTEALNPEETPDSVFRSRKLRRRAFHGDKNSLVFHADAIQAAEWMADCGLKVDCIVTSPPFYGQRDYEVDGQLGLEDNPQDYIEIGRAHV